ncbi:aldehyde dehydrogenase: dimeric NADP-preferring-like isoform X2 [Leptotrombidium deliense]|uniref:Aldehyde dehydrogenase: dimeric NADP-preferring-like isoform X2 n=1 Tax=Leptotrombidium deliense TaxID=299467 RepID=A0A443S3M3_9ACAR|nr:aldehyde dehydrogenase: dimeric NADP-preferring-like isoform X2 [Leptotrombidium deliense]
MQEEIFGPLLPVVVVNGAEEAIEFINSGEKPLSLYLFSTNSSVINKFQMNTSSGALCVNDTVLHFTVDALPFGGVGESGIGAYHGKYSFDTFTHSKSVLHRNYNPLVEILGSVRYPPYSTRNMSILSFLTAKRRSLPSGTSYLFTFFLGVAAVFIFQAFSA